jgi:hypothetical protein
VSPSPEPRRTVIVLAEQLRRTSRGPWSSRHLLRHLSGSIGPFPSRPGLQCVMKTLKPTDADTMPHSLLDCFRPSRPPCAGSCR